MKAQLTSLTLGLALLAGTATAGYAADFGYAPPGSSIKDGGAAVPVPAPIPVPVYDATWYFRFDVAASTGNEADATEQGMTFGAGGGGYSADELFGVPCCAILSDAETRTMFGVGVGYRFSERVRGDVTLESRREHHVRIHGTSQRPLGSPAAAAADPDSYYEATFDDDTHVRGAVTLFNAYYDFTGFGRFKPYVGGGLGFSYDRIKRENSMREVAHDLSGATAQHEVVASDSSSQSEDSAAFAAAVAVGLTYEINEYFDLDVGYRYLHIDGQEYTIEVNGYHSRVTIDDTNDHQIRAGLRWNVY